MELEQAAAEICRLLAEANRLESAGNIRVAKTHRDSAGRLLVDHFRRFMSNYFRRRGVAEDQINDYIQDTYIKLLNLDTVVHSNAFAVICRACHSTLVDAIRARKAGKRQTLEGQSVEVEVDEDAWQYLAETRADDAPADAADIADCVQRKLAELRAKHPVRATVLELWSQGHAHRHIASIVYDKAPVDVTKREEANVRQRVDDMKASVQALFQECKE